MKIKYILLIFKFLIQLIYSFNFVKSYAENKIISFLNSERFNNFIFLRIDDFLEKDSDEELTEEEIDYYSNLINKILTKDQQVINRIEIKKKI